MSVSGWLVGCRYCAELERSRASVVSDAGVVADMLALARDTRELVDLHAELLNQVNHAPKLLSHALYGYLRGFSGQFLSCIKVVSAWTGWRSQRGCWVVVSAAQIRTQLVVPLNGINGQAMPAVLVAQATEIEAQAGRAAAAFEVLQVGQQCNVLKWIFDAG